MANSETFLDLYKKLEDELENKYRDSRRRFSSVVFEFMKDPESEPVRESLDVCREIRNLLTHSANIGGEPIVEPSEPVLQALREVLEFVENPPLALSYATQGESIMKTTMTQKVFRVMEVMEKNGFSHIPVMQDGSFIGVFSVGTIFKYVLNGGKQLTGNTVLKDLVEYLPVKYHLENYAFLPRSASYFEARAIFERMKGRNRRVSVIFITENGAENERLLGMLTPWDVMGEPG